LPVCSTLVRFRNEEATPPRRLFTAETFPSPPAAPPTHVVGIGGSAGGLEALKELVGAMPGDTGLAFVHVQHLSPAHPSLFASALAGSTSMPVAEVEDGTVVEANHVYIIPPNAQMTLVKGTLRLTPREKAQKPLLPINHFFHSLAADRKATAIGIVLSGTASDGAQGLKEITTEGGISFVQDPVSAKHDGMPRSAIAAGFVLSPRAIAKELAALSREPLPWLRTSLRARGRGVNGEDALAQILALLRTATGIDFTHYKRTTVKRRIARRMSIHRQARLADHLHFLEENPAAVSLLCEDIFVHVTRFFRDPEAFDALKRVVLPELLKHLAEGASLRVWVPGCSTGEDAYSLAIALLEFLPVAFWWFAPTSPSRCAWTVFGWSRWPRTSSPMRSDMRPGSRSRCRWRPSMAGRGSRSGTTGRGFRAISSSASSIVSNVSRSGLPSEGWGSACTSAAR
jgi:two-component system CheB/CheR fusion protein